MSVTEARIKDDQENCGRVVDTYSIQHAAHRPQCSCAQDQTQNQSQRRGPHSSASDIDHGLTNRGARRHTDADLSRLLRYLSLKNSSGLPGPEETGRRGAHTGRRKRKAKLGVIVRSTRSPDRLALHVALAGYRRLAQPVQILLQRSLEPADRGEQLHRSRSEQLSAMKSN